MGTRKAILWSVSVYNKKVSSPCNLSAQIEQLQDKTKLSSQCNLSAQIEQVNGKNTYIQISIYNIYVITLFHRLLHFVDILGPYVIFVLKYVIAEVLITMPYVPVTFYNLGKAVGRITNSLKVWYTLPKNVTLIIMIIGIYSS